MWTCPKCKNEVSDNYQNCPNCGSIKGTRTTSKSNVPSWVFALIASLVAIIIGLIIFISSGDDDTKTVVPVYPAVPEYTYQSVYNPVYTPVPTSQPAPAQTQPYTSTDSISSGNT